MNADEWIERFAAELGVVPPTDAERDRLLALAGVAAHSSERRAAPIACWVTARAGLAADDALAVARTVAPPPQGDQDG